MTSEAWEWCSLASSSTTSKETERLHSLLLQVGLPPKSYYQLTFFLVAEAWTISSSFF